MSGEVSGEPEEALSVQAEGAVAEEGEAGSGAGGAVQGQGVPLQLEEPGLQEQQLLEGEQGQLAAARAQPPQLPRRHRAQAGAAAVGAAPGGHGSRGSSSTYSAAAAD